MGEFVYFLILLSFINLVVAGDSTNLGTINTVSNGFATVDECKADQVSSCVSKELKGLQEIIGFSTDLQCVASNQSFGKGKSKIPKCPLGGDSIKGLDNTYPSGGIFALYDGTNDGFINDIAQNYLKNNDTGKVNIVLPIQKINELTDYKEEENKKFYNDTIKEYLGQIKYLEDDVKTLDEYISSANNERGKQLLKLDREDQLDKIKSLKLDVDETRVSLSKVDERVKSKKKLLELLKSKRVNVIDVPTLPAVGKWMQDSFQFTTINNKPALYQLDHHAEEGSKFSERLACQIAAKCNLPYYIPPDMVNPTDNEVSNLNSGGNLEVLPGGSFITGIVKTAGFNRNLDSDDTPLPFRTKSQKKQKIALESAGNDIVELDISFLEIGHVDEIFSIVKTNKPSPCDFAIMLASPEKAFELMESSKNKIEKTSFLNLFIESTYAGLSVRKNACKDLSYKAIQERGDGNVVSDKYLNKVYKSKCLNNQHIDQYVGSDEYHVLKRENLSSSNPVSISKIMEDNKKIIVENLKKKTGCSSPVVIDVPVFFRNGLSYTPDLVNGVVQTPPGEASRVILPRSYFEPFDKYVEEELSKHGVKATFAHDMGYHLQQGEVHCGTNSARICRP